MPKTICLSALQCGLTRQTPLFGVSKITQKRLSFSIFYLDLFFGMLFGKFYGRAKKSLLDEISK